MGHRVYLNTKACRDFYFEHNSAGDSCIGIANLQEQHHHGNLEMAYYQLKMDCEMGFMSINWTIIRVDEQDMKGHIILCLKNNGEWFEYKQHFINDQLSYL